MLATIAHIGLVVQFSVCQARRGLGAAWHLQVSKQQEPGGFERAVISGSLGPGGSRHTMWCVVAVRMLLYNAGRSCGCHMASMMKARHCLAASGEQRHLSSVVAGCELYLTSLCQRMQFGEWCAVLPVIAKRC
jgi:hypothetical protein